MAEGRQRNEWEQVSALIAAIGNFIGWAVAGKEHKPILPASVNPFTAKAQATKDAVTETDKSFAYAAKSGAWKDGGKQVEY
jgi:hypothetical protein